jgi:AcrR family transcriptional regulator
MTKTAKDSKHATKRDAILDAALDLVVEGGFHGVPMSAISKCAKASPGVIYYYFASKEEIFQTVYERARLLKRGSLLEGYNSSIPAKEAFILVALNSYAFYRRHQKALRFVELYEDAGFPVPDSALKPTPEAIAFQRRFCSKTAGGILAELPREVIHEMTFGLVARLAKQPQRLSETMLRMIAGKVWQSIKA